MSNLCTRLLILIAAVICTQSAWGQSPKRELRAAWIATVSNIDWPSKPGLSSIQQQKEFTDRLNQLRSLGCNAVIVQIRPACDAFYNSDIEPWSKYLTGKQGKPPTPYYDPLKFMIEEAHKRNMEFHAWFNPYRALVIKTKNPNPPDHVTHKHRNWLVNYGTKTYLNPGIPEVRKYVIGVITDVVARYDIDAVHLDDYFYPYRIAKVEFPDNSTYNKYRKGFRNKDDWRRNNVDLFVSELNFQIKQIKPYVKLGISPFGVWRNASKDPRGSATRGGQTCYDDLYSDVLLWLEKGWIDYLMPQLYWRHNHRAAAFDILLPWWEQHASNRHIYYGLGVYRMLNATKPPWNSPKELLWQMRDIRSTTQNAGYSFYSSSNFNKLEKSLQDSIKKHNSYIALPPTMPWLDNEAPLPATLQAQEYTKGLLLEWTGKNPKKEPLHFAIYRFGKGEKVNLSDPAHILAIVQLPEYFDPNFKDHRDSKYVVTVLDRLWNESKPSNIVTIGGQ